MHIKDMIPWGRDRQDTARNVAESDHPLLGLQRNINRVFDDFWGRFDGPFGVFNGVAGFGGPSTDVAERDDAVEVAVELPGLDEQDIEVSLTDDALTIRGEKKAEREHNRKGYHLSERSFGSFYRAIPLPSGLDADAAKATFKNGVLTVTLPKTPEAQAKVRKIEVRTA